MRLATALLALFLPALALAQTYEGPDLRTAPGKLISPVHGNVVGGWSQPLLNEFGYAVTLPTGLDLVRGSDRNMSIVHKFGRNDNVASATWERVDLISDAGATYLTSGSTIRIKAGGNAADDSAGAGCRSVSVQGLRSDTLAVANVVLTPDGANASTASSGAGGTFLRVFRAFCSSSGTYGAANTGDIVIEDSGGTTDLIQIDAGEGQSQFAGYSVPSGFGAYLLSATLTVDNALNADFRFFMRENISDTSGSVSPPRLQLYFDGIAGTFNYQPVTPLGYYNGETDLWWEARGGGGAAAEVTVEFELLLIEGDG